MLFELYSMDTFVCQLEVYVFTPSGLTWVPVRSGRVPGGYQDGYIIFYLEEQEKEINLKDPFLCVKFEGEKYKIEIYEIVELNGKTEVRGSVKDYNNQ